MGFSVSASKRTLSTQASIQQAQPYEENTVSYTGECFCGSIHYEVAGQLYDTRSCHCSRCRKAFSAQASSYAAINADDFTWLRGESLLTTHATGNNFGLQFCSRCGSTLCGIFDGKVHGITLGCLNGNPDIQISKHIFVGSKAPWEVIPEGVVQFEAAPPEADSD